MPMNSNSCIALLLDRSEIENLLDQLQAAAAYHMGPINEGTQSAEDRQHAAVNCALIRNEIKKQLRRPHILPHPLTR